MEVSIIPENSFPLRPKPDTESVTTELKKLIAKEKLQVFEKVQMRELIVLLGEFQRRLTEEAIYYWKPNPAQSCFVRTVCPGRLFVAGNKTGKTEALVVDYLMKTLGIHPAQKAGLFPFPSIDARIVCSDFINGIKKAILPRVDKYLPPADKVEYSVVDKIYFLHNKSTLEAMSNEQDVIKFGSVDRHLVGHDEPCRQEIFGENVTRLTTYGGCWDIVQTPDWTDPQPWVRGELFPKARKFPDHGPEGIVLFSGTYQDNLANLDPDGVETWINSLSGIEKETRLKGIFPEGSSFIFADRFFHGIHTCEPFAINKNRLRFRAIDLGIDCPTVCLWAFLGNYSDREGKSSELEDVPVLYIYDEYYKRGKTIPESAQAIKEKTGSDEIHTTFIDPKSAAKRDDYSGLTRQKQWANEGVFTVFGKIDIDVGIQAILKLMLFGEKSPTGKLFPQLVIFDNCRQTIKELKSFTVNDLAKKDSGHCISALRWLSAANLTGKFARGSTIAGAYYGKDGLEQYMREYRAGLPADMGA